MVKGDSGGNHAPPRVYKRFVSRRPKKRPDASTSCRRCLPPPSSPRQRKTIAAVATVTEDAIIKTRIHEILSQS